MTIAFPLVDGWDFDRERVTFPADVDGRRITCGISLEALQDDYGGILHQPVEAFRQNRSAIEKLAERLIRQHRFESDGSILIRSGER